MSNSLVFFNCSPSLMECIRQVLAGDVSTMVCDSWNELCDVMQGEEAPSLVAEVTEDSASESGLADDHPYSLSLHRRQVVALGEETEAGVQVNTITESAGGTLADQIDQWERHIIAETLRKNRNHRKETAAMLGISRVTLYNKMKKFGML